MAFSKEQKIIVILLVLTILGSISIISYLKENQIGERHVLLTEGEELTSNQTFRESTEFNDSLKVPNIPQKIAVHIEGAVQHPGLYYLDDSSRYDDAVKEAGGLLHGADRTRINLARKLYDEAFIYIPMVGEEWEPAEEMRQENQADTPQGNSTEALININTANQQELMRLSGIGEVYAQRIIDYRTTHGDFKTIEDITKVSGIGNVTFENIKDHITK